MLPAFATVMLLEKTGHSSDLRISLGNFLQQPGSYQVQAQTFRAAGGDLQADRGEIVNVPFILDRRSGEIRLSVGDFTLTKLTIRHLPPTPASPQVKTPVSPVPQPIHPQPAPTVAAPKPITTSVQQVHPSIGIRHFISRLETALSRAVGMVRHAKPQGATQTHAGPHSAPVPMSDPHNSSARDTQLQNVTSAPPTVITISIVERLQRSNDQLGQLRPAAVDELFGAMETEVVDDNDSHAGSIAALLAFVPDEILAERKRRGWESFAAGLVLDDEMRWRFESCLDAGRAS